MYREFQPSLHLARYVECYWHRQEIQQPESHRILPDGCSDIMFSRENGGSASLNFVGLMTTAQVFRPTKGSRFFGIRFRPAMAGAFLRDYVSQIDCKLSLDGKRERGFIERLAEARSPLEMIGHAEAYLGMPEAGPNPVLSELLREPLERVSELSGASPRNLRRLCLANAGVSPKYLTRILRFRRAAECVRLNRQASWADLAAACGYFDQSHLIREFQEFAGCTPGRFLQSLHGQAPVESLHGIQS